LKGLINIKAVSTAAFTIAAQAVTITSNIANPEIISEGIFSSIQFTASTTSTFDLGYDLAFAPNIISPKDTVLYFPINQLISAPEIVAPVDNLVDFSKSAVMTLSSSDAGADIPTSNFNVIVLNTENATINLVIVNGVGVPDKINISFVLTTTVDIVEDVPFTLTAEGSTEQETVTLLARSASLDFELPAVWQTMYGDIKLSATPVVASSELKPFISCDQCTVTVTQNEPTGAPTQSPTDSPTNIPTEAPTTLSPTSVPTSNGPTAFPTTNAPTAFPTTVAPTTLSPTTDAPTAFPTTNAPTAFPTTDAPTAFPTTNAPTTLSPTEAPTKSECDGTASDSYYTNIFTSPNATSGATDVSFAGSTGAMWQISSISYPILLIIDFTYEIDFNGITTSPIEVNSQWYSFDDYKMEYTSIKDQWTLGWNSAPAKGQTTNTMSTKTLSNTEAAVLIKLTLQASNQNSGIIVGVLGCEENPCKNKAADNFDLENGNCASYESGQLNYGFCDIDKYEGSLISTWCRFSCDKCGLEAEITVAPTASPTVPTNSPTNSPTGPPTYTQWPIICEDDPDYQSNWPTAFGDCASYDASYCTSGEEADLCNHNHCAEDYADWFCPKQCNTCETIGWESAYGGCPTYSANYMGCEAFNNEGVCNAEEDCQWGLKRCESINHGYCKDDEGRVAFTGPVSKALEACPIECKPVINPLALAECPRDSLTWTNGYGNGCSDYDVDAAGNIQRYCDADGATAIDACPNVCPQEELCIPRNDEPCLWTVTVSRTVSPVTSETLPDFCGMTDDVFEIQTTNGDCVKLVNADNKRPVSTVGNSFMCSTNTYNTADFTILSASNSTASECELCPELPSNVCDGLCTEPDNTKCTSDTICNSGFICKSGYCAPKCGGNDQACFCDEICLTYQDCCASRINSCDQPLVTRSNTVPYREPGALARNPTGASIEKSAARSARLARSPRSARTSAQGRAQRTRN